MELLHLCFFHLTEFNHLIKQSPKLSNIAFDLLVNQYVNKSILPSWGIFLDEFQKRYPKLELPPFQTSEYYFKELKKDKELEEKYVIDPNAQHCWGLIDENGNPVVLNEAQEELVKERLSGRLEELANNAKAQGNAPSYCDQFIKEFVKPKPKFNYKKYIKTFVGNSTEYIVRKSYYKVNPRFPDNPRVIQEPKGKILVLVDESGSVSEKELIECLNEIHHISKTTPVEIRPFDTEVMKEVKYNPKKGIFTRTNCGGTLFSPLITYYESRKDLTTCIVFTDGYAETPPNTYKNMLWVITSNGDPSVLKGLKNGHKVIQIPKEN